MFTNLQLVAFVLSMVDMPYWYGTCVYPCTEARLKDKAKQYPSHYAENRMAKYQKAIAERKICMDCVGMIKGFFWTNGGVGVVDYIKSGASYTNKYLSNGCPDKSADGMLNWCKSQKCDWGKIDTIPDVPGVLVFFPGHVGVYIGDGWVVEARGFNYGVVKTKLSSRPWKHWAYLPDSLITYTKEVTQLGERLLKRGATGEDVEALQTRLNALRIDSGAVDGDFGKNTEAAVKTLQKTAGIKVDGLFGADSMKALVKLEAERKSVEAIAREVLDGKWGNGSERKKHLEAAGYNYREVQDKVNELCK